jgi:ubiquinone/menaquinone biosynthesis C-methylase UbiE
MKPSSSNEVRDMYDATAASYAEMMDTEINLPVYADVLERLQTRIANIPGALIDTACGSGHMLSMYHNQYDSQRALMGIDLSPQMVEIARNRLGSAMRVFIGDMRDLSDIEFSSAAAVLNWFAFHHLEAGGVLESMKESYRVLAPGGQFLVATWEGAGPIDYGDDLDIVAIRYTRTELTAFAQSVGFEISKCVVGTVEDFPMDAVYLECTRN